MAAPWLADALRAGGLPVIEEPGWQDRGTGGTYTPIGVLLHHTAGPASGNLPSLGVVKNGRSDLVGPLAQLMLARDGAFHVIAAGRANHAGAGGAVWVPNGDGNRYFVGIEAESTGTTDDWTPAQRVNYPRGAAALCAWMKVGEANVLAHREWAPTRKIDPAFWDMNAFRADVRTYLSGARPAAPPVDRKDDDTMFIKCELDGPGKGISTALLSGPIFMGLGAGAAAAADGQIKQGHAVLWVERSEWDALDQRSHALCDNPRPVCLADDEPKAA